MAPKKKGQKLALGDFLADSATGGSWADEMDDLPTGPSGDMLPSGPGLGGSHLSRNARDGGFGGPGGFDRPERPEVPFPTAPPYTAFVGNLTFEVVDDDLRDFFAPMEVTSVRIVSGPDGRPKGFGYVEFTKADDLRQALGMTGMDLGGRVTRISVAEPASQREGRADAEQTWTRQGPLAPLPGRSGGFGGSGGFSRGSGGGGFDRDQPEVERDGPIRGGKFTPSTPAEPRRFGGGFSGGAAAGGGDRSAGGFERKPFEPAPEIERDAPIRGGKFQPTQAPPARESRFGGAGGDRRAVEPSRADEEKTWTRSGPLPPASGQRSSSFGKSWGDRTPPTDPPARQRLQLSGRTTSGSQESSPSASPAPQSRASPFGAAKPVDVAEREREIEAKLAKEREAAASAKNAATAGNVNVAKDKAVVNKDNTKAKEAEDKIMKARLGGACAAAPATPSAPAAKSGGDDEWTTVSKGSNATSNAKEDKDAPKSIVSDKFGALSLEE
ncbi:Eukaryotic translation initiation factor 4B [Microbotryomycetes sp. JL221]|nr:Eukaryotic translation initiation factor 4B [Microbotryomycetes sp. JL221]